MSAFLSQHLAALGSALRRLVRQPLNSVLSLLVIGIALAFPSAGWVALDNLQTLAGHVSGTQQISLFMTLEASRKDVEGIETRLRAEAPGRWRFVSKEEALRQLQAAEGMAEIVAGLPRNPLPDAFIVEPADARPEALEALAKSFAAWPRIAHVQLDSAWVRRFDAFVHVGKLAVALLAALFAAALVAATFNTIRLQIMAQAAEIEVSRLIGATEAFIRRPFLYFGALQGILGGLAAALLIAVAGFFLAEAVGRLAALYGNDFSLSGLSPAGLAILLAAGGALGWLGAWLSLLIHRDGP